MLCREAVDFQRTALQAMQHEATGVATESIRQNDVCAGVDEALMQGLNPLRVFDVPSFRCIPCGQSHSEQVRAGGAVSEEGLASSKQCGERSHLRSVLRNN